MFSTMFRTALAILLLAGAASAQEKYTLKQTYAPGSFEFSWKTASESQATVTLNDANQPPAWQKLVVSMSATLDIEKPNASGLKKGTFTYRCVSQDIRSGSTHMWYDSGDPNTDTSPMSATFKPLIGAPITFEITPDGNIQNVRGIEEVWDKAARDNPRLANAAAQLKKEMGPEQIRKLVLGSVEFLPEGPVAVGATWKAPVKLTAPLLGQKTEQADCKLEGVTKDGVATISFQCRGGIDKPEETKIRDDPATVSRMEIHQKGAVTFDLTRKMIAATRNRGGLSMEVDSARGDQKMKNVSRQDFETEVTLKPADRPAATEPAK